MRPFVLLLAGLALPAFRAGAQQPLRIGTVTVHTLDVYTPAEAARGWPWRFAATLHVRTRESTVRQFLLFHEGDVYEPERLAETERNLRAQPFIQKASVTAGPPHDGVVDVTVTTQDTWTTEPRLTLSRKGGITTFGVGLVERDLLGTGRTLELHYAEEPTRITRSFAFIDPNLLGPYRRGTLIHSENSDGRVDQGGVQRPFASVGTARAGTFLYDLSRRTERIYGDGVAVSEYRQDHRGFRAEMGFALRRTAVSALRLTAGLLWLEDRFHPLPGREGDLRPDDRRYHYLFLQGEIAANDLVKIDYVDHDSRYQDFNLAPRASLLLGLSPAVATAPRTTGLVSLAASAGARLGLGTLLLGQATLQARVGDPRTDAVLRGEARLVHRFGTTLPQTLVARLALSRGWDLDADVQFFADGETGLRGYRLWAFEGSGSTILNLEHRISWGHEILQVVSPGAAVFFDAGAVTAAGRGLGLGDVKSDLGVGLRLALPRSSVNDLVRIDVAWPLAPGPGGGRGILVSFSSSQAF